MRGPITLKKYIMRYCKYPVEVTYNESYLPPRCRKPRYREAKKSCTVRVRCVTKDEAPVAFFLSDYEHKHEGTVKIRLYKGKLYMLETWQRYAPGKPECPFDREFIGFGPTVAGRLRLHNYNTCQGYEEQAAQLREEAARRLVIDGLVWILCGEPVYEVRTFGLGHNHGGSGLFVETCYNPNISKDRYFNALQGDEAVAAFNAIAQRRGDTDSVGRYGKMIEVLIPECVKRNPKKEHGDGDPFLNTLNAITDNASSPMEAGLLAIMAAKR